MSIESVMPSSHLILCRPLLLLPSIFSSDRVFSNESVLHIKWLKYWSFSFSISLSKEYSGLISFRIEWFYLLVVQGILKSLFQHHYSKVSIFQHQIISYIYNKNKTSFFSEIKTILLIISSVYSDLKTIHITNLSSKSMSPLKAQIFSAKKLSETKIIERSYRKEANYIYINVWIPFKALICQTFSCEPSFFFFFLNVPSFHYWLQVYLYKTLSSY